MVHWQHEALPLTDHANEGSGEHRNSKPGYDNPSIRRAPRTRQGGETHTPTQSAQSAQSAEHLPSPSIIKMYICAFTQPQLEQVLLSHGFPTVPQYGRRCDGCGPARRKWWLEESTGVTIMKRKRFVGGKREPMITLEISLPDPLAAFVTDQVQAKGFADTSEYVTALLHQEWKTRQKEERESKLLEAVEALDRGEGRPMTAADWERLREQIRTRYKPGDS